ncbi:MAG: PAS domain-containing protein, partial [Planctomycetota bacterium]
MTNTELVKEIKLLKSSLEEAEKRLSEHKLAEHDKRLQRLTELSITLSGEPIDIFKRVAEMIGELLDIPIVCLSEIQGDELYFLSVYNKGEILTNAGHCPISITPCSTVEDSKDMRIYQNVIEKFPKASFLKTHNAFSYCGFPSLDSEGNVISVTCLLDDKPHEYSSEDKDLLQIFAQRIGIEMERKKYITERKNVEQTLQDSEERYRSLINEVLDNSNVGVFILDKEFRVVWINKALESYFGLKRDDVIMKDKRQLIKNNMRHIFEDGDKFKERVLKTYDDNSYMEDFVCHILPGDGREERWLEHWSQPIVSGLYAGGRVELYTDITERKRVENALSQSKEQIQSILDNATAVIYLKDTQGKYILINRQYQDIFHVTKEEIVGKTDYDIFPKEMADAFQANDRKVLKAQAPLEMEEVALRDDGPHTYISIKFPLFDSNGIPYGVCGISTDITERKRAEKMLLESSEEKYQILANSTKAISWICDVSTWQFTFVGAYAETLFGYRIEEWYQENFWQNHIHPDDREQTINYCVTSTQRLEDHEFEYRMIASDGQIIWIYDIAKVTHSKGEPIQL